MKNLITTILNGPSQSEISAPRTWLKAGLMAMAVFAMLALPATGARADIDAQIAWTAKSVAGEVLYREGGEPKASWRALRKGGLLSALAELRTGPDGRAVLAYQESTITVAPRSEFKLPAPAPKNAVYRVAQKFGTFLYKIKHAARDKFEVRTPYLTTIIKGTIFSVNVNTRGAAVHVTEGAVFVQPKQGGNGAFVRPGQSAQVTNKSQGKVELKGLKASGASGDKRSDAGKGSGDAKRANRKAHRRVVKIVFRDVKERKARRIGTAAAGHNGNNRESKERNASVVALEASEFGLGNSGPGNNNAGGNGGGLGGGIGGGNAGGNGGGLGGGVGGGNAGGNGGGNAGGNGGGNAGGNGGGKNNG